MGRFKRLQSILKDFSILLLAPGESPVVVSSKRKPACLSVCIFLRLKYSGGSNDGGWGVGQRQIVLMWNNQFIENRQTHRHMQVLQKTEWVRCERAKKADRYKAVTPKGREVWQAAMMSKLQDKKCNEWKLHKEFGKQNRGLNWLQLNNMLIISLVLFLLAQKDMYPLCDCMFCTWHRLQARWHVPSACWSVHPVVSPSQSGSYRAGASAVAAGWLPTTEEQHMHVQNWVITAMNTSSTHCRG